ncbi:MAG: hypothetical protein AAGU17_07060 [Anaerolineaceae bacterium]|jgi:hypothetical protein
MADRQIFEILVLNARPAAGKSEVIDYLKKTPLQQREARYRVGKLEEIDDFPMLWTWFEEDALLDRMGYPRLHTDTDGYFVGEHLWHLLIERIGLEYQKRQRDIAGLAQEYTTLIEFSRGSEHGGYSAAFTHFSRQVVERMSVLYIDVSWEESLRKNRRRFNPSRPDSILEHGLPDVKLERLYRDTDWQDFSAGDPAYLEIQGIKVPYAVFDNADDVTTGGGNSLGERLQQVTDVLWRRYMNR